MDGFGLASLLLHDTLIRYRICTLVTGFWSPSFCIAYMSAIVFMTASAEFSDLEATSQWNSHRFC